jgi:hypothetical protein
MNTLSGSRAAPLVATSLGDEHLDPAVRDLALERLEGLLLAAVRTVPGAEGVASVSLSPVDGTVTLTPTPTLDASGQTSLRERIDRVLLAQLAATVGAARMAVRAGERARPRPSPPLAPPPRWEDVLASLVTVVASQHQTITSLLTHAGTPPPPDDEITRTLRRLEAMVARLREGIG